MTSESRYIDLSEQEFRYLKTARFLSDSLSRVIDSAMPSDFDRHRMSISRELGESFRSAFTNRLAQVGFGADYELTSEGAILEALVDRLYLP